MSVVQLPSKLTRDFKAEGIRSLSLLPEGPANASRWLPVSLTSVFNVVSKPSKMAFAGRKRPGKWLLKLLPKRFAAQSSASGLYNHCGRMAYQVDFLFHERLGNNAGAPPCIRQLEVPSLVEDESSTIYLQHKEAAAIANCLDQPCLVTLSMVNPPRHEGCSHRLRLAVHVSLPRNISGDLSSSGPKA